MISPEQMSKRVLNLVCSLLFSNQRRIACQIYRYILVFNRETDNSFGLVMQSQKRRYTQNGTEAEIYLHVLTQHMQLATYVRIDVQRRNV